MSSVQRTLAALSTPQTKHALSPPRSIFSEPYPTGAPNLRSAYFLPGPLLIRWRAFSATQPRLAACAGPWNTPQSQFVPVHAQFPDDSNSSPPTQHPASEPRLLP